MNERQFQAWLAEQAPATVPASLRERIEGISATPGSVGLGSTGRRALGRVASRRRMLAVGLVAAALTGSIVAAGVLVRRQDDAVTAPSNGLIAVATGKANFVVVDPVPGRPLPTSGPGGNVVQAGQNHAAVDLAFSSDGRSLATIRAGALDVIDLTTGARETLLDPGVCSLSEPCGVDWSPDGKRIAYTSGTDLRIVDLGTRVPTTLVTLPGRLTSVSWSPDGRTLAFTEQGGATPYEDRRELLSVATDGSDLRHLVRENGDDFGPMDVEWSPDGTRIGYVASEQQAVPTPGLGVAFAGPYRIEVVTVAQDGSDHQVIAQIGSCYCLGFWPPGFTWSPDGRQIAFVTTGYTPVHGLGGSEEDPSRSGLFVSAVDGSDSRRLLDGVTDIVSGTLAWQPVP